MELRVAEERQTGQAGGALGPIWLMTTVDDPPLPAIGLVFHQQATDQLGGHLLGGAGEEGVGEVLGEACSPTMKLSWWIWEWLGCAATIK